MEESKTVPPGSTLRAPIAETETKKSRALFYFRVLAAAALGFLPPLAFEKYTFYLYAMHNPIFFNFSGSRFWFDIGWFLSFGAICPLIIGRKERLSNLIPGISAALFIIAVYQFPFCDLRECYVSSPDGLASLRDFLFFGSLSFLISDAVMSRQVRFSTKISNALYSLAVSTSLAYALGFYPTLHIYAGVTMAYPFNYVQWFLASCPPAFLGAFVAASGKNNAYGIYNRSFSFLCGLSGLALGVALALTLPCEACGGYGLPLLSLFALAAASSFLGVLMGEKSSDKILPQVSWTRRHFRKIVASATIVLIIGVFLFTYFAASYEASVVNQFSGVENTSFSQLEVGSAFPHAAGYLTAPKANAEAVGVTVSFGNTTIANTSSNFLAAGIGVQSPNCCKDGLDLAYRADAMMFSNGTEAVVARTWWACDVNMACGGYSWQELLHFGIAILPSNALSDYVELEMNWTSPSQVGWFYRIHYSNTSVSTWVEYSEFGPPKIDNSYFDIGYLYLGLGNPPLGTALFFQFGVSSARAINGNWHAIIQCPKIMINGSWTCIQGAGFASGAHSYWKVLYTFGTNYPGVSFSYLGNETVEFYYSGESQPDGATIW